MACNWWRYRVHVSYSWCEALTGCDAWWLQLQKVRGLHLALVAVVDEDKRPTGKFMFVRYCSNCWLGVPLQMFKPGRAQCNRCIARTAVYRANRAERPARPSVPPKEKWSTPETALELDGSCITGHCIAKGCWEKVQRKGQGSELETRALPMCPDHMPVRATCPLRCPKALVGMIPL